ncbi:hypothetical protein [Microbacterium sp. C7(2022)]|uniref:hypothetical protein n=1 Tax=Microbacterium sp. C7(2022) TaxID=2992759 RepID=UPI00237BD2A8|nr:hypothetical protein [Microbacterium sp. C7(2022)]MDE0545923.1 hypothetical protein [Microbacterium sp. C7(2022)]
MAGYEAEVQVLDVAPTHVAQNVAVEATTIEQQLSDVRALAPTLVKGRAFSAPGGDALQAGSDSNADLVARSCDDRSGVLTYATGSPSSVLEDELFARAARLID